MSATSAGFAVAGATVLAVFGPLLGLSPAWIALGLGAGLLGLTLDASQWQGLGGHLLAETLPGGRARLQRIACHEAGHLLVAQAEAMPVRRVLVGTKACLQAGLRSNGATEFELPDSVRLSLEDLRRWSRVLQAGMAAETLVYGQARGGADDRALLGRLWGLSGHDVPTAQREQRRARREVDQQLRRERDQLEQLRDQLLTEAAHG
ncbi:peptidase M41 family [Synechococcus sp. RS9909]|nr:peptidase M41 family [Synechococcus sp. RS9909]